ncbi:hypothetical protein NL676_012728 [Syzygium grande]|nr:hypothetical protein NL676_012728 [Syzygium grande]
MLRCLPNGDRRIRWGPPAPTAPRARCRRGVDSPPPRAGPTRVAVAPPHLLGGGWLSSRVPRPRPPPRAPPGTDHSRRAAWRERARGSRGPRRARAQPRAPSWGPAPPTPWARRGAPPPRAPRGGPGGRGGLVDMGGNKSPGGEEEDDVARGEVTSGGASPRPPSGGLVVRELM